MIVSSISGLTNTLAKLVCLRFAESNGEMRTSRCTPVSPVSRPNANSPVTVNVADLIPASSPSWISLISVLKPCRSAQRRYMRISISAQSWLSVPPAPGCTVTIAFSAIRLAREHRLRFELLREIHQRRYLALQVRLRRLTLLRQLEVRLDVVHAPRQFGIVGQQRLQPLALAHQRLRARPIRPHRGVGNLCLQLCPVRASAAPRQRYSRSSRTRSRTGE